MDAWTVNEAIVTVRGALATSDTLRQWCRDTFQRDLTVQVGENPENPAGENEAPCVIIEPQAGPNLAITEGSRVIGMEVFWMLRDATLAISDATDDTAAIRDYRNVALLDEFGMRVWDIIRAAFPAYLVNKYDYALDAVSRWPLSDGHATIGVEAPNNLSTL